MRKLGQQSGFTLIEVIVFIMISALLMSTILLGSNAALRNAPNTHQQWMGLQVARGCMEWYLQQSRLQGYASIICPSTPTNAACQAPAGYTVTTNIACTTWNSDPSYKTITVTVSGLTDLSLSTQIGDD